MDHKGDECVVAYTLRYSRGAFTDGRVAMRAYITDKSGLASMVWLPVFVDWWPEDA